SEHVSTDAYHDAAERQGAWVLTSTDGGKSWSDPVRGPDAIHGGIVLTDGTWMAAAYREENGRIGIHTAEQSTGPWQRIQTVDTPANVHRRFGEPHLAQLPSGRIVLAVRSTAAPYDDQNVNN